ncbi:hypothetical protein VTL71DRAFT_13345 [Oculimacula yallundae]|uniref:Uncharacterized protein n=1 Tax=Oculimacula yallundae TaxID=86028 RepID=A0ABR4CKN4_9HELO
MGNNARQGKRKYRNPSPPKEKIPFHVFFRSSIGQSIYPSIHPPKRLFHPSPSRDRRLCPFHRHQQPQRRHFSHPSHGHFPASPSPSPFNQS